MVGKASFVLVLITWVASTAEGYNPRGSSTWGYFAPPLLQRVPQTQQTPMEAMVELTNELAIAILQDHSFSRGNFAFSPYGVASVLVVLYEGSRGESARQIHRAVGFPMDKDVIRVGFRDIHRHLRSYFSHEGYLSGISLNREGSSLRPEYKKILRFYGYDVELNHTLEEDNVVDYTTVSPDQIKTTEPLVFDIMPLNKGSTTKPGTTIVPTTLLPSRMTPSEGFTHKNFEITTPNRETETTTTTTTTDFPTTVTEPVKSSVELHVDLEDEDDDCSSLNGGKLGGCGKTSTEKQREEEMLLRSTEFPTTERGNIYEATNLDNGMLIPQFSGRVTVTEANSTPPGSTTETTLPGSTTETTLPTTENTTFEPWTPEKGESGTRVSSKNKIQMSGNKKDRVSSIRNMFSKKTNWLTSKTDQNKTRLTRTITDYLKAPHSPELSLQLQNGMYDTHISRNANLYRSLPRLLFLVDGAIDTPVPMMTYTNVFPYAYVPRLHTKAMEFPLDDERYKLLILLPVERRGLRQLIYDLAGFPLNNILKMLRPERVKAMVPSFMVEGFVILTSSLQKLGIWDVFDPRKANLSGMSMDPELYVRNVEQSVTVVIRNYVEILDIQTRTMAARHMEQEFEATHPFLYFVMDTATNVALMAGQILDPLNSRIY